MARFITGHMREAFSQKGVFGFDPTAEFFVKQKSGKFRRATLLKKFNEYFAGFWIELLCSSIKFAIAYKVMAVVILSKFFADGL